MPKIEKKNVPHDFFLQFYEPPDLGKKFFTTWNALKSEVYLTCINFWKIHDLKACLEVDPKMWNLVSICNFLRFWPPEKAFSELMTNLIFSFSESGPEIVHIPPKTNIFI